MSQKTFANHLDDFEALHAQQQPHQPQQQQAEPSALVIDTESESTILAPYPLDAQPADPLLQSRVPAVPADAELQALLAARPLTYLEVRAGWGGRYPVRVFCEMCGYWGRVKCLKCGTRLCALDCLEAHREECVTRYGL